MNDITFAQLAARYDMQPYELAAFLAEPQRADTDDASDLVEIAEAAVAAHQASL